jgi:hypothetical protein
MRDFGYREVTVTTAFPTSTSTSTGGVAPAGVTKSPFVRAVLGVEVAVVVWFIVGEMGGR